MGATFCLEPVATLDIDVFVAFREGVAQPPTSLPPIYSHLTSHGYKVDGEYIMVEGWPVQFLPPFNALVAEALARAAETEVEGVKVRVMTAEHLTAIALQTGRAKNLARVFLLIESGLLDTANLEDILQRHGLHDKWLRFSDKFKDKP